MRISPIVGGLVALAGVGTALSGIDDLNHSESYLYSNNPIVKQIGGMNKHADTHLEELDACYIMSINKGWSDAEFTGAIDGLVLDLAKCRYDAHSYKQSHMKQIEEAHKVQDNYTTRTGLKIAGGALSALFGIVLTGVAEIGRPKKRNEGGTGTL